MENQKYAILMSACINPPELNVITHAVHRSNPIIRLNDYKTSLLFWMAYKEPRIKSIIFVENSGYNLTELYELIDTHNVYKREIEILQFQAKEIPKKLHYGYSELEIIDYAFDNSKCIAHIDYVIKVTGRLTFPKVSDLININSNNYNFISDCRDFNILKSSKHYILTTIFIVERSFYKQVLYKARLRMLDMNCGLIEVLYYEILKPLYNTHPDKIILRFPFNVDPVGVGAHWGVDYSSFKKTALSFLRNISRRVLPGLWI